MEPLKIPLSVECATINDVSVWEWAGSAYDQGAEVAELFPHFWGAQLRWCTSTNVQTFISYRPSHLSGIYC